MKLRAVLVVTAALCIATFVGPVGASAAPAGGPPASTIVGASSTKADLALAKRLVNRFFVILQQEDSAALEAFLSDAFQVARPDGTGADKEQYLKAPPVVDQFSLSGFHATRAGDTLVVRYTVTASEMVNGEMLTKDPAPRLSVFTKDADTGKWQLAAHANFNGVPAAG